MAKVAFGGACILTVAAVFYSVERWRWRTAWDDYAAKARERGVKLDIADFPRPKVPDADNFATLPYFADSYRKPVPPDGFDGPVFDTLLGGYFDLGTARFNGKSPADATRSAVASPPIQKLLSDAKREGAGGSLASEGADSTIDAVQLLLRILDEECGKTARQLREGADRAYCQFPADGYDEDDREPKRIPFIRFRKAAQLEAMRANLHIAARDGISALDDVRMSIHLGNVLKSEPYIVAAMMRVALTSLAMESVWSGLNERVWDDAALAQIDRWLAEIDLLAGYRFGIETERTYFNRMFQRIASSMKELAAEEKKWGPRIRMRLCPNGWVYRNQIKMNQYCDAAVASVDLTTRTVSTPLETNDRMIEAASKIQDFLFLRMAPGYFRTASRTAAGEALLRQARTACALERYRLKHGVYPDELDALVTERLIPALPRDPIDNALMEYQRMKDGRYSLRSVETVRVTRDVAPWPEAWMPSVRSSDVTSQP